MAEKNRLYSDLAHLWPMVSKPEDYAEEASYWRKALRSKLGDGRHAILDLGVGGGNNLSHLAGEFDAVGVDPSSGMLEHCAKLIPDIELHVGDMRTVRLNRTFDAVLIHDAISYMLSEADLRAAFDTASAHLKPGGVLVVSPDYFVETFTDNKIRHDQEGDSRHSFSHVMYEYRPTQDSHTVETIMLYIIRDGDEVTVEEDRHQSGLFTIAAWERIFDEAGFDVERMNYPVHEDPRQCILFVAVKR